MEILVTLTLESAKAHLCREHSVEGAYELVGFDFLVDAKGKVWLLELNRHPSFNMERLGSREVKTRCLRDLIRLLCWEKRIVESCESSWSSNGYSKLEVRQNTSVEKTRVANWKLLPKLTEAELRWKAGFKRFNIGEIVGPGPGHGAGSNSGPGSSSKFNNFKTVAT